MNNPPPPFELVLASPRGFCAGVERAITIVEKALEKYGPPIYVRHEIVHNSHVVNRLREQGVVFVEDLKNVPESAHAIFSAHGVSPRVRLQAETRQLKVLDATCPLVTKVHGEARSYAGREYSIILIGHKDHVEVEGTVGEAPERMIVVGTRDEAETVTIADPNRVAYLTQTTLSQDDTAEIIKILRRRFPNIEGPAKDDICYATQNRQNAVKALTREVDLVLVVGASNSSNTLRLVEVAKSRGVSARRVESAVELDRDWLNGVFRVGITAGASAPEAIVQGIVNRLLEWYQSCLPGRQVSIVRNLTITEEDVLFALPPQLRNG